MRSNSGSIHMKLPVPLAFLMFLSSAMWALAATRFGTDLRGQPVHDLAIPGTRAVVLFFAASDCPLSNRYFLETQFWIRISPW